MKARVNPKSTSNQSNKPCTVLQYQSKKAYIQINVGSFAACVTIWDFDQNPVSPSARGFHINATLWFRDCFLHSRHNSTKTVAMMITGDPPAPLRLHRTPRRPFNESSTASLAGRAASHLRSPLTRNSQQRLSVCDFANTNTQRWASVTEASLGAMANPATSSLGVARVPVRSELQL